MRLLPNIIITGTPGCGKTSHSQSLVAQLKELKHVPVSDLVKEKGYVESYNKEFDTTIVDEDKLLDDMEQELRKGGRIIDWHCCEIFPERLIDLVVVLRTDNSRLYERMQKRGYKDNKIQENLDAEIMEVVLQEARDSYRAEVVVELRSETADDMDENVERIVQWIETWKRDNREGVSNEREDDDALEVLEQTAETIEE